MNEQEVLNNPFDIETHKRTFINYLEVIILEDGKIQYAIPSHQEKLITIACKKLNVTREELIEMCPEEYYLDFMNWLCQITNSVSLWNEYMIGKPNEKQQQAIKQISDEGLFKGRYC